MKTRLAAALTVVLSLLLLAGVGVIGYLLWTNLDPLPGVPLSIDLKSVEAGDIVTVSVNVRGERVTRAELWTENQLIARETNRNPNLAEGWTVAWQWIPAAPGVYPLAARVFDERGNYAGTPPFEVVVPPHVRLIYSSNADGKYALYTLAIGTRLSAQFNPAGGEERQPSVAATRRVAYTSSRSGAWHIWSRSLDLTNAVDLTPDLAWAQRPAWSPDGTRLAFEVTQANVTNIYSSDAAGRNRTRVTDGDTFDGQVSFAPNGRRIAFAGLRGGQWDIYAVDVDGQNLARLTNDSAQDWQPAWSPDGARIAFASNRGGASQIYIIPSNGGEPSQITHFSVGAEQPVWSPDGNWLAFVGYTGGGEGQNRRELYLLNLPKDHPPVEDRGLIRLTQNEFDDTEPAWIWQ